MLKDNNVFKYLAFSVLLYGVFLGSEILKEHLRQVYSITYQGVFLMFGVMILTPLLIGALLGIEKFLTAASKQKGSWKINWYRLLILGIPAFIIVGSFVFSLSGISNPIYKIIKWPFLIKSEFIVSSSFILGYVLGNSFYRSESS